MTDTAAWTSDSLWQKSKVFMVRALAEGRESPLFPFWAVLSLELLARSAVAKVHPSLLADPKDGQNILFACGVAVPNWTPRSVAAHTVLSRCQAIIASFTESDQKFCLGLINRRNSELHTGEVAFEGFSTAQWLGKFYRVAKILLESIGKSLEDLLGIEEAEAAKEMIDAVDRNVRGDTERAIGKAKAQFDSLDAPMRDTSLAAGTKRAREEHRALDRLVSCPVCGAEALMRGKPITHGEPRLKDNMILQDVILLPTFFRCFSCDLVLDTHALLAGTDLAGQYTVTEERDPFEFHQIDLADYFDQEYGND